MIDERITVLKTLRKVVVAVFLACFTGCTSPHSSEPIDRIAQAVTLPSGFVDATVATGWNQATGLLFASDGRMFVWEKAGKVWIVDNDKKVSTPFLDLSEEVGDWRDYGLLGFALHPDFYANGYVYLLYVVDYYYLKNFGTSGYRPVQDNQDKHHDTIGRLVRYTAKASDGYRSVDLSSRKILVGESITTGFPILHQSHGVGAVAFGTDGTLLASCGDGASYSVDDVGGNIGGSTNTGLADGIIDAKQDVGSFRSQLVDSLNGKILRLDPETGDGVASNPFYDAGAPRAARSRVWSLGLRNPYRFNLRPGTGSHHVSDGQPGTIYLGDVGYNTYEELDVARGPSTNFGWPAYEGLTAQPGYGGKPTANQSAPNPLYGTAPSGQSACTQRYFTFQNLIVQETTKTPVFPNPCAPGQGITEARVFMHTRPVLEWKHGVTQARTGSFTSNGAASETAIGAAGSPVSGSQFPGNCSTGGVWYTGSDFPATYKNTYFHGDFGGRWIKNVVLDANDRPTAVRDFVPAGQAAAVAIATHPQNGGLYFIDYAAAIHKISYVGSGNHPPVASATADVEYGVAPLLVHFQSSGSSDPEMGPLTFDWNFGDGTAHATDANPTHTFVGAGVQGFKVSLTVKDVAGATAIATLLVAINDAPPSVTLRSPVNGALYGMSTPTQVPLDALVTAASDSSPPNCAWQTILHHNEHTHPEPVVMSCQSQSEITPLGCDGNTYFYEFQFTATDTAGLQTVKSVDMYPDCVCYPGGVGPIVCTTPPDGCHETVGKCENGECNYAPIACTTPPDACHAPTGVCENGACSYAPIACTTPPDGCHERVGSCVGDRCLYPVTGGNACPGGLCSGGVCVPTLVGDAGGEISDVVAGGTVGREAGSDDGPSDGGLGVDAARDALALDAGRAANTDGPDARMDDVYTDAAADTTSPDRSAFDGPSAFDGASQDGAWKDGATRDLVDALAGDTAPRADARTDAADAGADSGDAGAAEASATESSESSGCGCRVAPRTAPRVWLSLLPAVLLLVRRRRAAPGKRILTTSGTSLEPFRRRRHRLFRSWRAPNWA